MKARRSHRKVTPFGGAIPVLKQIKNFKLPELIQECLGSRVKQAKYGYDDTIIAWMLTNLCGGIRLDHVTKLKNSLSMIPGLNLPSHDTLGRCMKQLATENSTSEHVNRGKIGKEEAIRIGRKTYEIVTKRTTNENEKTNNLLIKATKKMGLLNEKTQYVVDIDATFIPTNCSDAKKSYKKEHGFLPIVACIDKLAVYVGMRNGNVSPSSEIDYTVEKTHSLLAENNIKVGKVRMDAGGYNTKAFDYMEENNIKFYVGGISRPKTLKMIREHKNWNSFYLETTNSFWDCETASFKYGTIGSKYDFRLVVLRCEINSKKAPKTWIWDKKYAYKLLITNDWDSTEEELFSFYNQRGTSEKNFDTLKNDFGWRLPPFSNMNENTVFLSIAALTNNLYHGLLMKFCTKIKDLRINARLREFIYVFISVACEITADEIVFYDTNIAYEKIC